MPGPQDVMRAPAGRMAVTAVQLVALAARRMTLVTVLAREIRDRWPALTSVMRAPEIGRASCRERVLTDV